MLHLVQTASLLGLPLARWEPVADAGASGNAPGSSDCSPEAVPPSLCSEMLFLFPEALPFPPPRRVRFLFPVSIERGNITVTYFRTTTPAWWRAKSWRKTFSISPNMATDSCVCTELLGICLEDGYISVSCLRGQRKQLSKGTGPAPPNP